MATTGRSQQAQTPEMGAVAKLPVRSRGKRTREALINTGQRVFTRDGFIDARVADITRAAGVSHGSFYTYFDSKTDIFREVAGRVVSRLNSALEPGADDSRESPVQATLTAESASERISWENRRYLEAYSKEPGIIGLLEQVSTWDDFRDLRQAMYEPSVARVEQLIIDLQASELIPSSDAIDPHITAYALVGMRASFAYTWLVLEEPFTEEAAVANVSGLWLRGLGLRP